MQSLAEWLIENIVLAILVFTRLSLLLVAVPALGAGVPRRVLALLAITMTALLLPSVAARGGLDRLPDINNMIDLTIAVAREAVVGLFIGSLVQLIITGIQLGGEAITSTGGMQLGEVVDPTTSSSMPALARFIGMFVTAVMFIVGGHRALLSILIDSFIALPPGDVVIGDSMLGLVMQQLSAGIVAGIRISAPIVAALLMSNLVAGLISRTLPQINVLAIGLSINALTLLVVSAIALGSAGLVFQDELATTITLLQNYFSSFEPGE